MAYAKSMADTLKGVLERILFSNPENHFTIGELRPESASRNVTVTGPLPGVQCGETLRLEGTWTRHPVHGEQFKINAFHSELPASVYGIRKYLGSGLIPGIGSKYAEKIVDHFGEETLRIISEESARLREIPGIGPKRVREIKKAWDEQAALRDIMVFLQTYGVGLALCLRLIKHYGLQARSILQNEPYRVAREIPGIGFKTADRIARNLGLSNESPARLQAGILFALGEIEEEGHTAFPQNALLEKADAMLEVNADLLPPALETLLNDHSLQKLPADDGDTFIQSTPLFRAETQITDSLLNLLNSPHGLPPILHDKAVAWARERAGFDFAPEQESGILTALQSKVSVLTGGPGTGKTTILRALVDILKAKKVRVILAAPTGRAAQRMTEATGAYAQTVHRLLKFDPAEGRFIHGIDKPLSAEFVIVDESSMLDARLAAALFRAIPHHSNLLLVGDVNQLPSVGPGNVLPDVIRFLESTEGKRLSPERHPVVRLEKIFRQGERSGIVTTAHGILAGQSGAPRVARKPEEIDPRLDLHFIHCPDADDCARMVVRLCREYLPAWYTRLDPVMDVQVLPPMHKGAGGIANLNNLLQDELNPKASGIRFGQSFFQLGDKVIQTRNNYDKGVFNGDLGRITAVHPESGTLSVLFNGDPVDYERGDLPDLQLAYAISIHKSQGSEFPVVILPILKQHFVMLQRNLLYTGITRGRKKVFLVGDTAAYAMAVNNSKSTCRQTDLPRKLGA